MVRPFDEAGPTPQAEGRAEAPLARLLGEVARGEMPAFERLYTELSASVFGLCLRVVRDRAQAEEVAQEVFTEVWRRASRFDPELGDGRAWVLTMAHRRAVDRVRAEQASSDRASTVGRLAAAEPATDSVAEEVTHRLERQQVRRCLEALTEGQREAVRLTYYTGYTQRQAAELLGVPLTTVKGRLRDGLIRLRDCLGRGDR